MIQKKIYRQEINKIADEEYFYWYVEMPSVAKRTIANMLSKLNVFNLKLQTVSNREYRVIQEKIKDRKWKNTLLNRIKESKKILTSSSAIDDKTFDISLAKKVRQYCDAYSAENLLRSIYNDKLYDINLHQHPNLKNAKSAELIEIKVPRNEVHSQEFVDFIVKESEQNNYPGTDTLTEEMVTYLDKEYQHLCYKIAELSEYIKSIEKNIKKIN